MATSSARSVWGMSATGVETGTGVTGTSQIGLSQNNVNYVDATQAYAVGAALASGKILTLNVETAHATVDAGTLYDGDGLDFQGNEIANLTAVYGLLVEVISGGATVSNGTYAFSAPAQLSWPAGVAGHVLTADLVVTATTNDTVVYVTVLGK